MKPFLLISLILQAIFSSTIPQSSVDDLNIDVSESKQLSVAFPEVDILSYGQIVDLSLVAEQPKIVFSQANEDSLYTLAMVDPDAPSRENPVNREWLHWLKVNIKGSELTTGLFSNNQEGLITSFNPSTPPSGSGPHRYVFYVFEQNAKLDTNLIRINKRNGFKIASFVEDKQHINNQPVAFTFYITQRV